MAKLNEHFAKTIEEINENLPGITLDEIKTLGGGHIHYMVYPDAEYMREDVNALDLSVRATNGLRRAGYHTVGEIVSNISGNEDLYRIRNLGKKSVEEIMLGIFLFQYLSIKPEHRQWYLEETLKINGIRKAK